MLKKGKKILLLALSFALAFSVFAGCSGKVTGTTVTYDETHGGKGAQATSQGGFVVEKGGWMYFINGAADSSADNTYGNVVKGALMRVSKADMDAGKFSEAEIVVPELMVAGDYTAGLFIYGDYVYYATPNTIKNLDGVVESGYLNFRRASLDGSAMTDYYVQLDTNTAQYRYVVENDVVYLVYVGKDGDGNTALCSFNTQSRTNTVLVSNYTAVSFDESDVTNPVIYYTMPVTQKNTYSASSKSGTAESYNQLYRVSASATESPYGELDLTEGYTDKTAEDSDEFKTMHYTNLGTLVLDGIGTSRTGSFATPFNRDLKEGVVPFNTSGYKYTVTKYSGGKLVLSIATTDSGAVTRVYSFDDSDFTSATDWNSVTANPDFGNSARGKLAPVAINSDKATSSALYYEDGGSLYYMYVDGNGAIWRNKVGDNGSEDYIEESVVLAVGQSGATLLYTEGDFLYYQMSGDSGNNLYRIQYNGAKGDYNPLEGAYENKNFRPVKYLNLACNSSWYKPEIVSGYVFFSSGESYSLNYIYALANPADNTALDAQNEMYDDVQSAFTDISGKFSNASNLAKYYYYGGDMEAVKDEDGVHFSQYEEEDFKVLDAFVNCADKESNDYNFDFSHLKKDGTAYNTRDAFYKMLGKMSDDDTESVEDSLASALLLSEAEEEEEEGWTWQWAAIFVPVGVVVLAGVVVLVVLLSRKRRPYGRRRK